MVAITGANGLLGSYIAMKFIAQRIPAVALKRENSDLSFVDDSLKQVEWKNCDVLDSNSLIEVFQNTETVIHCAAIVSFDPRARKKIFKTNVQGTKNVVNACLSAGVKHLIFISSVAALGRKKGSLKIDEQSQWVESDLNSDYAKSKYLSELEVYRGQEEGLNISIINPSVILAPSNPNKSSAQIFNYVQRERSFYTDGSVNYVDVRDVAEMVYKLYEAKLFGEKIISSAGHVNLKELIDLIAVRLNKKKPSIKIGAQVLQLAAWIEEMRCRVTGTEALISRQSVKMSKESFSYENKKSIDLMHMNYRSLTETLDWCCAHYLKAFSTNKSLSQD
jgi:dihydroflavonol-4-reductase